MAKYAYTFTVLTPSYNRAHTLARVYESLHAQTFRDFEWVVVDDGSTDDTPALVRGWQRSASFPIRLVQQANGGQCSAINYGVSEAWGELTLVLDSDDACVPEALERFHAHWQAIPEEDRDSFVGVTCNVKRPDGSLDGRPFPRDPLDCSSLDLRYRYRVTGEKWGFNRTEVMRAFPFPEPRGIRHLPKSVVWDRIAMRYRTRFVNDALRIYYDTPGSLSALPTRARGAPGRRIYCLQLLSLDYPLPLRDRLRQHINYVRYSLHSRVGLAEQQADIDSRMWWLAALPPGAMAYLRDRWYADD